MALANLKATTAFQELGELTDILYVKRVSHTPTLPSANA